MFEPPFSKKALLLTIIFSLVILILLFLKNLTDRKTTVVFCDVGQGDGAYIRIKNNIDILIDAGPSRKILDCLGKYMPFYDKTIELAIITHAQKDHFGGFQYVLDRYNIGKFWLGETYKQGKIFTDLLNKINSKNIAVEFPKTGDSSLFTDAQIDFLWPSEKFIFENSYIDSNTVAPFRKSNVDLNDFSLIFTLQLQSVNILFTGDAIPNVLNRLLEKSKIKTDILKIPHHGSKNGLNFDFLKLADPEYGVISSGINNSYGHPHSTIIDMLKTQSVKIKRTDEEGDIVFTFN